MKLKNKICLILKIKKHYHFTVNILNKNYIIFKKENKEKN